MARYATAEQMVECPECLATFSEHEGKRYRDKFRYTKWDKYGATRNVLFGCPQCAAAIVKYDESSNEWVRREYTSEAHPYVSVVINWNG